MTKRLRCLRPDKRRYGTRLTATMALTAVWGRPGRARMDVYRCGDHWHFGNRVLTQEPAR